MEKIIPNGTEVLIFNYVSQLGPNQEEDNFIKGIVQSSEKSDDLSYHGCPYYEQIYTVLGENGKKYYGTYGNGLIGNHFFRTIDDHIEFLKQKIEHSEQEIKKIHKINDVRSQTIIELQETKEQQYAVEKISNNKEISNVIKHFSQFGSLEAAYLYPLYDFDKYVYLVLVYNDWNDALEIIAHGKFYKDFDKEENISLKVYSTTLDNSINNLPFVSVNGKIIYDKNGILTNHQNKLLNKTLKKKQ